MRLRDIVVALAALSGARRRDSTDADAAGPPRRIVAPAPPEPRAELAVVVLLVLAAVACVAFVVAYAVGASTQVLGGALAAAFGLLAAGLIVAGERLVVQEQLEETYPEPDPGESEAVARIVRESGSRLTRKRMLGAAAGTAFGALGVALAAPLLSLGPVTDSGALLRTPWRRGRRLVDSRGAPLRAEAVAEGTFYTAYPEGAPRDELGAPVVVVRVAPGILDLPPGREGWAPEGILAFSKICTHAGCAVSLYRSPTFPAAQPKPALVCPCHYSTFEPETGGQVLFGPAGRPLPQLPLAIDADGALIAAGPYSGAIGPSWSGVRRPPTA